MFKKAVFLLLDYFFKRTSTLSAVCLKLNLLLCQVFINKFLHYNRIKLEVFMSFMISQVECNCTCIVLQFPNKNQQVLKQRIFSQEEIELIIIISYHFHVTKMFQYINLPFFLMLLEECFQILTFHYTQSYQLTIVSTNLFHYCK